MSLGTEMIRMGKKKFRELIDSEIAEKLSRFNIKYPRLVLEMCARPTRSVNNCYFSKRKKR